MPGTFEVHSAFAIEDRGLFALAGEIRDGMVHTGMWADAGDGGDDGAFRERIHGVEFVDLPAAAGLPVLTFHYRDPAKLARWSARTWKGRTLSVSP